MEHIWTILMHKILQSHLLCAFVANLKIGAIYALYPRRGPHLTSSSKWVGEPDYLYPESFCDKNLANRKVFRFLWLCATHNHANTLTHTILSRIQPHPLTHTAIQLMTALLRDAFQQEKHFTMWDEFYFSVLYEIYKLVCYYYVLYVLCIVRNICWSFSSIYMFCTKYIGWSAIIMYCAYFVLYEI